MPSTVPSSTPAPRQGSVHPARLCSAWQTLRLAVLLLALPAGPASAAPLVLAYADCQEPRSYTNLQAFHSQVSAVGLGSVYSLTADGEVAADGMNRTARRIVALAKSLALPLYPTVSDYNNAYGDGGGFDPGVSQAVLATPAARAHAVDSLVRLVTDGGHAGLNIDLEAVQPADTARYTLFMQALAQALHAQGLTLVASVPPKTGDHRPRALDGYDYGALGAAADWLQVMTYDEVGPGWASSGFNGEAWPGPESGLDWQNAILGYTISRVSATKVLSGLPAYGYDYSTGQLIHWSAFAATLADHPDAQRQRDAASATPFATWGKVKPQPDGTPWSRKTRQPTLWFDDVGSIQIKAARVPALGLGGTSVWAMGFEDASFWAAVHAGLRMQAPTPARTRSVLRIE